MHVFLFLFPCAGVEGSVSTMCVATIPIATVNDSFVSINEIVLAKAEDYLFKT